MLTRVLILLRARLADLRDEALRRGYLDQPDAQQILADGDRASAGPDGALS